MRILARNIAVSITIFTAFVTLPGIVQSGSQDIASDKERLRHFKTVLWPQAYRNQDTELLNRLLDESFQMIDGEGNRSTKQEELEWIAENTWNPGTFEYRIERLDIYGGDTAIIDGTGLAAEYQYQSSNVLIKKDGEWRAVASHVSGYRERTEQD